MTRGRETAVIVKDAIGSLGGGFMLSPEARQTGKEAGLRGWEMYFAGRAGVLGDVHADVVASVLAFFPGDFVRSRWEAARAQIEPAAAVERFAGACHAWGRNRLSGFAAADRLVELLAVVVGHAEIAGLPVFAGWRAVPVPPDPPARVVHYAHLLREHRGGLHVVAVLSGGLSPLEAMVAGPYGIQNARFFQWAAPYPVLDDALRRRRAEAEDLTDDLVSSAYAALGRDSAAELVNLLSEAQRSAFTSEGAT